MPIEVSPSIRARILRARISETTSSAILAALGLTGAAWWISSSRYRILPEEHHSSRRSRKRRSFVQSEAEVQMRENSRSTLARQAPVLRSATSPGQVPEKLLARRSGLFFPTTPSVVCGP